LFRAEHCRKFVSGAEMCRRQSRRAFGIGRRGSRGVMAALSGTDDRGAVLAIARGRADTTAERGDQHRQCSNNGEPRSSTAADRWRSLSHRSYNATPWRCSRQSGAGKMPFEAQDQPALPVQNPGRLDDSNKLPSFPLTGKEGRRSCFSLRTARWKAGWLDSGRFATPSACRQDRSR
jgi:hypothetical protein